MDVIFITHVPKKQPTPHSNQTPWVQTWKIRAPTFPAPHVVRQRSQHVAVLLRAPQLRGGPRLQGRLRGAVLRQLQQLHRGLRRRGHRGGRGAANVDGSGGAAEGEVLQLRVGV